MFPQVHEEFTLIFLSKLRPTSVFLERLAERFLLGLALIQVVSIFGFAFFVQHPENLARFPWAIPIFSVSYALFARLQIVVAMAALACFLLAHAQWRWLPALFACSFLSLGSELSGTTYGLPFGAYSYTPLLGLRILGKVPLLIPFSWFFMSIASYALIRAVIAQRGFSVTRVILSAWMLLNWDLTLDPAMSYLTPFWVWAEKGEYFGMPAKNIAGWFLTGILIVSVYELLRCGEWLDRVPKRFFVIFYGVNLMLPAGIVLFAGYLSPIVFMFASYLALALVLRLAEPRFLVNADQAG